MTIIHFIVFFFSAKEGEAEARGPATHQYTVLQYASRDGKT